jgi:hypothetical protein
MNLIAFTIGLTSCRHGQVAARRAVIAGEVAARGGADAQTAERLTAVLRRAVASWPAACHAYSPMMILIPRDLRKSERPHNRSDLVKQLDR